MTSIFGAAAEPLVVDVWSDVVCPFCYIGHAELNRAIDRFPHGSAVEVRYHSFQLNPDVPAETVMLADDYLSTKYGMPADQVKTSHGQLAARGASLGLDYHFETALMVNTRDAHRLIHLARGTGHESAMVERLFKAEFTDGLNVADPDVLAGLAAEIGLDRAAATKALAEKSFETDIEADLSQARQLGISGVPFFVFDGRRGLSGAQPGELFLKALTTTWDDRLTTTTASGRG